VRTRGHQKKKEDKERSQKKKEKAKKNGTDKRKFKKKAKKINSDILLSFEILHYTLASCYPEHL